MGTDDSEKCDVLVVGGGGSGLAAAIESAVAGSRTVLLEKNPALGGSTAWSVGSVTASNTPHQRRACIEDRPEWHWQDMALFPGGDDDRDNSPMRRILCDDLPDTFEWLLRLGIRFFGPVAEPPHRVARMHTVLPNSGAFIYHLRKRALAVGVDIRLGASVEALKVVDRSVRGVGYVWNGRQHRLDAGAVVLTAGDFTNDPSFKKRFMGERAAVVPGVNATATGDGQRMAEAVGAVIINGPLALGPELRFQAPPKNHWTRRLPPWTFLASFLAWAMRHLPARLLRPVLMKFLTTALAPSTNLLVEGALLIDADGRAVKGDLATIPTTVAGAPGNQAWLILDARVAAKFQAWPFYISTAPGIAYAYLSDYARNRPDICRTAHSLEELAKLLHVNPDILSNSARTFRRPRIPESGGGASDQAGLESGPFWALGPVKSVFVHSEGGLETDLEHRILTASGDAMLGLYAAGSTGQTGLLLRGHGHHLAWAFSSGRRAGVRASRFARSSD